LWINDVSKPIPLERPVITATPFFDSILFFITFQGDKEFSKFIV
jgi:hypothetical protein